eukprot:Transcript_25055.p1 GENE.Transcript_25055~~Transcript_25055.p1  ORF type:complete len:441 (-),score=124.99 Transcript_25055:65-1387(-)
MVGTPAAEAKKRKRSQPGGSQPSLPKEGDEMSTDLDTYTLVEPIGEGTFSVVFKAQAERGALGGGAGHSVVAAKILKDGQSDYTRITKEFRCLAALKGHENVVSVLDGSNDGCRIMLVMPYFEHEDFGEKLHSGAFTDVHIGSYMTGLFSALIHIHNHGFIHRDIKPTNVLYNFQSRRTKVVDFGLVQMRDEAPQAQSTAARDHQRGTASGAGSPRNRKSVAAAAAAPAAAAPRESRKKEARTTTSGAATTGSTADARRAARSQPNAPLMNAPGFRAQSGHLFGGVGHLQTLLARREGTRGFRAPEVLCQCEQQSPAIDVWSAGIILLCLLTKRYPIFEANDDQTALYEICVLLGPKETAHAKGMNYDTHLFPAENCPRANAPAAHSLSKLLNGRAVEPSWARLVCSCLRFDPKQRAQAKAAHESLHPTYSTSPTGGAGR